MHKHEDMMKTAIIFLLFILFSFLGKAQNFGTQTIYNELETEEDILVFSLKKDLVDFIDLDLDYQEQINRVTGDIHFMKTLVATSKESADKLHGKIKTEMDQLSYEFTSLEKEIDQPNQQIYMYTKRNGPEITEVHFLIVNTEDHNAAFFTMLGDLILKEQGLN